MSGTQRCGVPEACRRTARAAFTLVELLVVLAIIGLLLAVALPSFRAMNEGRSMEGATRQLLSDLQFARQSAIATRSTVAVVFIPPGVVDPAFLNQFSIRDRTNVVELQGGALTSYALLSFRQTGEQPGRNTLRYLTSWKTLPERVFIAENMFDYGAPDAFWTNRLPFPTSRGVVDWFPYVAFNPQGQCLPIINPATGATPITGTNDVLIRLAAGSIMYTRDPVTREVLGWTVQEVPPDNSNISSNVIRIDWLTGRAKLERADVTRQ